ncbi:MAG: HAD-IIIC family phosphatase [Rhodospirillales bacterium]|nr:HAD-IIIC family phosphatase [Rhodospirillales bacterium]
MFLACDFVIEDGREAAAPGVANQVKCVVFDLDDTLWTGVLLHGDRPRLRPGVERVLRELDRRGILLSLASKNDYGSAWEQLIRMGLDDLFLHPQIGWQPKSIGIARIADHLNLGLDAFAFVDDNPFERAEVAAACPEVVAFDAAEMEAILDHPRFRGSDSVDAARRRQYYRDEMARNAVRKQSSHDYGAFLRSCDIELSARTFASKDLDRTAELIQRTNQLNFSGRHYGRDDILRLVRDSCFRICVMTCRDRFGDYGTIGVAVVARLGATLRIEDLMLSCRVQGRGLERAVFAHLITSTAPRPERLWVRFRPTARNAPARQALEDLGFRLDCDGAGDVDGAGFILDVTHHDLQSDVIRVIADDWAGPADQRPSATTLA